MPIRVAGARHVVSVLAFDGMSPFELGSVAEIFGLPRPELDVPWYELRVCAQEPGRPLRSLGGLSLTAEYGLDAFAAADTVMVVAVPDVRGDLPPAVLDALRAAHRRGARVVSICSGAFALAAAGLLDGRTATTHWRYADLLRRRYPRVEVDPDVLYVDDGDIATSAGSAAGLDLCLHLVRKDHGAKVAATVARRLVIPPHRDGGQAQFIEAAIAEPPDDDAIARSMSWALEHLAEPIAVADLARQAHMAPRTFIRHFRRHTGTSPLRWVIVQRIMASLPLLESGVLPVEHVGAAVGFPSPATFRHHFTRIMKTTPSAYRRAMCGEGGSPHSAGSSPPRVPLA
ncbi:helix-turn-helix domain-containing protein [Thermomonospora cellulosilytica]|uniref:AraC family transcriptional activator FtrA n=1 Tax=Thermomonospora cellulosilytica TaxID=1411118 RepID=A0A7W3MUQ8_9ACTN|nr:helix-turn-helix domain-containing protein [Thermomonospora cellulosilytica]MBA9002208.1 AraC family transcriptional activator FtrA [Thermomonospora cellulosilytica]